MKKFGLIGNNISYSKSPLVHQKIAKSLNNRLEYCLLDVKENELEGLIKSLKNNNYQGFNVTIPYKETIIKYLDILTIRAQKIGAVNTIYLNSNGLVVGDNTDYEGFKVLFEKSSYQKNDRIIVLGSGGASKAVCNVLKDLTIDYKIVSRTPHKGYLSYQDLEKEFFDLIINTTPLGSQQYLNESPLDLNLSKNKKVIDLIYSPVNTPLMLSAKYSVNGLIMLIVQALYAQSLWFDFLIDDNILNHVINKIKDDI